MCVNIDMARSKHDKRNVRGKTIWNKMIYIVGGWEGVINWLCLAFGEVVLTSLAVITFSNGYYLNDERRLQ